MSNDEWLNDRMQHEPKHWASIEITSGWDVVAALVGLLACLAGYALPFSILSEYYVVLWVGAPAVAVILRRRYLPRLTPAPQPRKSPPTALGWLMGMLLMIGSGFVAAISGIVLGVMCFDGVSSHRAPAFGEVLAIAITSSILACSLWGFVLGLRKVR